MLWSKVSAVAPVIAGSAAGIQPFGEEVSQFAEAATNLINMPLIRCEIVGDNAADNRFRAVFEFYSRFGSCYTGNSQLR